MTAATTVSSSPTTTTTTSATPTTSSLEAPSAIPTAGTSPNNNMTAATVTSATPPMVGSTTMPGMKDGQLSVLPSPSIQLARSMMNIPVDELVHMSAFDLFKSQIETGSIEACVDAVKRLGVVAATMDDNEQVSTTLLPYLTQLTLQQPPLVDELLLVLGQQLTSVADVLADPVYILDFLPMMERLSAVEETVVREQAVTVLNEFARRIRCHPENPINRQNKDGVGVGSNGNGNQTQDDVAADEETTGASKITPSWADPTPWIVMSRRLASADWFTAKVSACGILAAVFQLLPAPTATASTAPPDDGGANSNGGGGGSTSNGAAQELLQIYKELCHDETPMVRRAAAKHIGDMIRCSGWTHRDFAAQQVPTLCRDEQDSVRLLAVASLSNVGPTFGQHSIPWTIQHWLPLVRDGSTDLSWRVRHNLAKHFSDVANSLGISYTITTQQQPPDSRTRYNAEQSLVMACFVALLRDAEAEVRAAAVGHLARMVTWGGPVNFNIHLQPLLAALADDVVMEVRSKCALALMDTAHNGTLDDAVILHSFGPLLESFLQDEFQEVQLQVLTNLHKIAHLLPGLTGVVTSLLQMSRASNWRVREAIAKLLPHLAEARGLEFFTTVLLEPAWLTLLLDPVASVRMALVQGMSLLVRVAGEEWVVSTLLPHHMKIYNQSGHTYLIRITLLQTYVESAVVACKTTTTSPEGKNSGGMGPLFPDVMGHILRTMTTDKVANVRMVAAVGVARVARVAMSDPAGAVSGSDGGGRPTPLMNAEDASDNKSPADGSGNGAEEATKTVENGGEVPTAAMGATSSYSLGVTPPAVMDMIRTVVRPALEQRIPEEDDADCRSACQLALDSIPS